MVRAMVRCAWIALLAVTVAACGSVDDNRPLDAQYVTAAVLAPTCGAAECHSTFTQAGPGTTPYVFDTLVGMRRTIVDNGLVILDSNQFDPSDPAGAALIAWLTKTDPFQLGIGRMPYDAPMPNEDIHFLEDWIQRPGHGDLRRLDVQRVARVLDARRHVQDPERRVDGNVRDDDVHGAGEGRAVQPEIVRRDGVHQQDALPVRRGLERHHDAEGVRRRLRGGSVPVKRLVLALIVARGRRWRRPHGARVSAVPAQPRSDVHRRATSLPRAAAC